MNSFISLADHWFSFGLLVFFLLPFFLFFILEDILHKKGYNIFKREKNKSLKEVSYSFIAFLFSLAIYSALFYAFLASYNETLTFYLSLNFLLGYLFYLYLFVVIFIFLYKYKIWRKIKEKKQKIKLLVLGGILFLSAFVLPLIKINCYYQSEDNGMTIDIPKSCEIFVPELLNLNKYLRIVGRGKGLGEANLYYLDGQLINIFFVVPYFVLFLSLYGMSFFDKKEKNL